jgi:hypothetical protein
VVSPNIDFEIYTRPSTTYHIDHTFPVAYCCRKPCSRLCHVFRSFLTVRLFSTFTIASNLSAAAIDVALQRCALVHLRWLCLALGGTAKKASLRRGALVELCGVRFAFFDGAAKNSSFNRGCALIELCRVRFTFGGTAKKASLRGCALV